MKNGYVKIYRKMCRHSLWVEERFSRGQAWLDLILLANHKDGFIRKRGIRVVVKRGEVAWSERELADRWKWSRGKVRRFLTELCSGNDPEIIPQTEPQNQNVTSRYKIVNYDKYQGDGTTNSTASDTTNGPQTGHKRYQNKNEKNTPEKIQGVVFDLKERYPDPALIDQAIQAIASTRKSNRVSDSIIIAQLEKWSRYPVQQVEAGIRTYLQKGYAGQGMREEYLLGIIRNNGNGSNSHKETTIEPPKVFDFSRQFHEE